MKFGWLALSIAALIVTTDTSLARPRHRAQHAHRAPAQCVDRPVTLSWGSFWLGAGPPPAPNGCAPPVYQYGRYVGQDPDPFVRLQLVRDPKTGAAVDFH